MTPTETAYESWQGHVDDLMAEVEQYLAAVEDFRAEGCEPVWADDEALGDWWQLEWHVRLDDPAERELPSVETRSQTLH